jgi:hypothetical protein
VEVKEQYQVKASYRFSALEKSDYDVDISRFGKVLERMEV